MGRTQKVDPTDIKSSNRKGGNPEKNKTVIDNTDPTAMRRDYINAYAAAGFTANIGKTQQQQPKPKDYDTNFPKLPGM